MEFKLVSKIVKIRSFLIRAREIMGVFEQRPKNSGIALDKNCSSHGKTGPPVCRILCITKLERKSLKFCRI